MAIFIRYFLLSVGINHTLSANQTVLPLHEIHQKRVSTFTRTTGLIKISKKTVVLVFASLLVVIVGRAKAVQLKGPLANPQALIN